MAKLLKGKEVSDRIKDELKEEVAERKGRGIHPGLAVILVGDDPASKVYVNNKKKACEYIGIKSFEYLLPAETSETELLELIDRLNSDPEVSGILCQLPLPGHIDETVVINAIAPCLLYTSRCV